MPVRWPGSVAVATPVAAEAVAGAGCPGAPHRTPVRGRRKGLTCRRCRHRSGRGRRRSGRSGRDRDAVAVVDRVAVGRLALGRDVVDAVQEDRHPLGRRVLHRCRHVAVGGGQRQSEDGELGDGLLQRDVRVASGAGVEADDRVLAVAEDPAYQLGEHALGAELHEDPEPGRVHLLDAARRSRPG